MPAEQELLIGSPKILNRKPSEYGAFKLPASEQQMVPAPTVKYESVVNKKTSKVDDLAQNV